MKHVDTLLDKARHQNSRQAEVATHSGEESAGKDLVDAINQMFAEFELAYHNQFHKAYAREGSVALAKKYWLSRLGRFSPEVILQATREVVSTREFLPSLSSMVSACENALALFGLPPAHQAYIEACFAPEPKTEYQWSHPAVYFAGRATGWFELASQPESRIYPVFEYNYRVLCSRVMNGEDLAITPPEALPANTAGRQLSREENRRRMELLRDQVKL